jgi:hypothetical protein
LVTMTMLVMMVVVVVSQPPRIRLDKRLLT